MGRGSRARQHIGIKVAWVVRAAPVRTVTCTPLRAVGQGRHEVVVRGRAVLRRRRCSVRRTRRCLVSRSGPILAVRVRIRSGRGSKLCPRQAMRLGTRRRRCLRWRVSGLNRHLTGGTSSAVVLVQALIVRMGHWVHAVTTMAASVQVGVTQPIRFRYDAGHGFTEGRHRACHLKVCRVRVKVARGCGG